MTSPLDAWRFSRIVSGVHVNGEIDAMSGVFKTMATHLESLPQADRGVALSTMAVAMADGPQFMQTVFDADPLASEPVIQPLTFATAVEVSKTMSSIRWNCEGWIPASRIVGIAALEGTGKSRFELDLCRRVHLGLLWHDGQKITIPKRSPSLWVCADGQHDEIADMAAEFGLPGESIILPAPADDPYANTSLDDPEIFKWIDGAIVARKPWAVFIDSLTYATTRDLSEQRTIAILKTPLIDIVQRHQINVFLSLHVSKEGQALGRRIKGITRTLLHLECPDPEKPERLRLWVEKSYGKKPPALGVTMGDGGNEYDFNPPAKLNPNQGPKAPEKLGMAIAFISKELANGDKATCDLVREWEARGGTHGTFFNARRKMVADGKLVVDDSKKPQMCHLVSQP